MDKCVCLYKIYETALKTAIKRKDRRENVFCLENVQGTQHYLSVHSKSELQQFETAYYNCVYKSVIGIQVLIFFNYLINFRQERLLVVMKNVQPV